MAVTVEEIEIIVRAKVEEALKELRKIQPELQKLGDAGLSNISSQAKTIAPAVSKAAEAVKKSNKEIQAAAKAAADQYGDLTRSYRKPKNAQRTRLYMGHSSEVRLQALAGKFSHPLHL